MKKKSIPLQPQTYKKVVSQSFPAILKNHFRLEKEIANNDLFIRYKAYHLRYYKSVTLTILKDISKIHIKRIDESIKILKKINQPNILPIIEHGFIDGGTNYYWVTPYVIPVNWNKIINYDWNDSELLDFIIDLFSDLFGGLKAAIKHNLIHGMICPETIFIFEDKFCLSDFGLPIFSKAIKNLEEIKYLATKYSAPEIIKGEIGDFHTDLYSIGILLRELFSQIKSATFFNLQEYVLQLTKINPEERYMSIGLAIEAFNEAVNLDEKSIGGKPTKIEILDEIKRESTEDQIEINIESMPVLSKTISEINTSAFDDVIILHINHCLEDIFKLNEVLYLLAEDLIFVTIPYGSQQVPQSLPYTIYYPKYTDGEYKLYKNGNLINQVSNDFNTAMTALISQALEVDILKFIDKGKKILLIEDGGYHYNILHELNAKTSKFKNAIIGVIEQTTSGLIRCNKFLKEVGSFYPVLTIARSDIKMRQEAYFIGRRVVDELNYLLYEFNDFLTFHNVVIIGYGIIGRSIATCLEGMNCNISVVDIDKEVALLAKKEGYNIYEAPPKEFFKNTPIIIGATGESSFTYPMLNNFLEGKSTKLFLASASSKQIEFADLIEFFEGSHETPKKIINLFPSLKRVKDIQIESNRIGLAYHFKYQKINKSIILVARGFPVNFYRPGSISLTHSMIDPIYAEIVLLAQYLTLNFNKLNNKLYLLGYSTIPDLDLSEDELITKWIEFNKLSVIGKNGDVWSNFNIHPLEKKLRGRYINE